MWLYRQRTARAVQPATAQICVGIVYREADQQVLMVHRRLSDQKLTWQFPSGHLGPKDVAASKVVDEVYEETNVQCKVEREFGSRVHPDTKVKAYYFRCRYLQGEVQNLQPDENLEVAWVPKVEVEAKVTSDLDPRVKQWLDTGN